MIDLLRALKFPALFGLCLAAAVTHAQVNVTTYHYDNFRSGQNTQETILTPSNVNSTQFGKLFQNTLDGFVVAQPLYLSNVSIAGGTHNVLFVATEHDSVYAIDADTGAQYWQVSLIPAGGATVVGDVNIGPGCDDIVPEIGITGTPVIDPTTGTLYVVAKSIVGGKAYQYLHALDVIAGGEKFGGPVVIGASLPGTGYDSVGGVVTFNALFENQRAGLLLDNGHVVIAWGSHCDYDPWHGWLMSYGAATLTQEAVFSSTPNGQRGGIWMGGGGVAADAAGNIYFSSGNGTWDGVQDFGDTVTKLGLPAGGSFPIEDYFTPWDQATLESTDTDLASGGITLLPTLPSGQQLLAAMGKLGTIYVTDRNNMGKYCGNLTPACTNNDPQIVQEVVGATSGIWGSPAYWNGNLYWTGANESLKAFAFNTSNGIVSPIATSQSGQVFQFAAPTPTVSANGSSNGIVWALDGAADDSTCVAGTNCLGLYAYGATNLGNVLYISSQAANNRDSPGSAVKFAVPVVANGKVYVGGQYAVTAYGELAPYAAAPSLSLSSGTYLSAQSVTLSDATPGATIYYTTNGTAPTTASAIYAGPLTVGSTTTIEAIAVASGYTTSNVTSATYVIGSIAPAASPTASPAAGSFSSPQTVTLTDATPGATIYYTTNGTAPTTASAVYTGGFTVSTTTTIEAIAVANGYSASPATGATYTITGQQAATSVSLAADSTVYGIANNGSAVLDGGMDYAGHAYSANLLGNSVTWAGSTFLLGSSGSPSAVRMQVIPLPPGNYASLNMLATAVNGAQTNQVFTVTYSDGTTSTYTQSLSDWVTPASYPGETQVVTMPYRLNSAGTQLNSTTYLYGYSFALNSAKTVKSFAGPGGNGNIIILAVDLLPVTAPVAASPTISPAGGVYNSAQTVTLADATPGAFIYYTLDGSTPTTSSAVYTAPLTINTSAIVSAIAAAGGYTTSPVASATYSIAIQSAATSPTFSPAAGSYSTAQTVTLADSTPDAIIYYTTNNTTPTTSSAVYSTPLTVSATTTIEAIAVAGGYTPSPVASATYTITPASAAASPTFSPAAGAYSTAQTVTLADATPGAFIYYTLDGSTPSASSAVYGTPLNVGTTTTVNAIAVAGGYTMSPVASATYTISPPASPVSVSLTSKANVYAIANTGTAVPDGGMDYAGNAYSETLLGSSLSWSGASFAFGGADVASGARVVKIPLPAGNYASVNLLAAATTNEPNQVFVVTYSDGTTTTITQSISSWIAPQNYTGESIALTMPYRIKSSGAENPTNTYLYGYSFAINSAKTVASLTLPNDWNVVIMAVDLMPPSAPAVATPTFSPVGGSYTGTQTVTLADATPNATIYYTVNGSTPTTASAEYTAPLAIGASTTVNAIAVANGYTNSAVGSATFVIGAGSAAASPTFSPVGGGYTAAQTVTLADATAGAAIYYTLDGSMPTTASAQYTGTPLSITATTTVTAIAAASGYTNSPASSATYTITPMSQTPVPVSLSSAATVYAISNTGTAVLDGGFDYSSNAYSETLLGGSLTWSGATFTLGAAGVPSGVRSATIPLPAGNFAAVMLLAAATTNQPNLVFTVTYTDGTTTSITQSVSGWISPQHYSGESTALAMSYRIKSSGATQNTAAYVYGYSFPINVAKTVAKLTVPKDADLTVMAVDLVP